MAPGKLRKTKGRVGAIGNRAIIAAIIWIIFSIQMALFRCQLALYSERAISRQLRTIDAISISLSMQWSKQLRPLDYHTYFEFQSCSCAIASFACSVSDESSPLLRCMPLLFSDRLFFRCCRPSDRRSSQRFGWFELSQLSVWGSGGKQELWNSSLQFISSIHLSSTTKLIKLLNSTVLTILRIQVVIAHMLVLLDSRATLGEQLHFGALVVRQFVLLLMVLFVTIIVKSGSLWGFRVAGRAGRQAVLENRHLIDSRHRYEAADREFALHLHRIAVGGLRRQWEVAHRVLGHLADVVLAVEFGIHATRIVLIQARMSIVALQVAEVTVVTAVLLRRFLRVVLLMLLELVRIERLVCNVH